MIVISLNDRIKSPYKEEGALAAYPQQGFFVIEYPGNLGNVKIFFNQDGREVFRVHLDKKAWWKFWGR